jgi:hypothetical protein
MSEQISPPDTQQEGLDSGCGLPEVQSAALRDCEFATRTGDNPVAAASYGDSALGGEAETAAPLVCCSPKGVFSEQRIVRGIQVRRLCDTKMQ